VVTQHGFACLADFPVTNGQEAKEAVVNFSRKNGVVRGLQS
jgi:hypothetical protein